MTQYICSKPLHDLIGGFNGLWRAGRSTTEQVFNLRILCEKHLQHQQDLYHVFLDVFKRDFDRGLACSFVGNQEDVHHLCAVAPFLKVVQGICQKYTISSAPLIF